MFDKSTLNHKIMIVDDDQLMRALLVSMLHAEGFEQLIIAKDGVEASKQFISYQPDIIFLDIEMPGVDGIESLRLIKKHNFPVQIIMVSNHTTEDWLHAAIHGGASAFLVKPITLKKISAVINECSRRITQAAEHVDLFVSE